MKIPMKLSAHFEADPKHSVLEPKKEGLDDSIYTLAQRIANERNSNQTDNMAMKILRDPLLNLDPSMTRLSNTSKQTDSINTASQPTFTSKYGLLKNNPIKNILAAIKASLDPKPTKSLSFSPLHLDLAYLREPMMKAIYKSASNGTLKPSEIFSSDNKITSLAITGNQIFDSQAKLIEQAQNEVFFQTFNWQKDSKASQQLQEGLMALAKKNPNRSKDNKVVNENGEPIKVRILINEPSRQIRKLMWPNQQAHESKAVVGKVVDKKLHDLFDIEVRVHKHHAGNSLHSKSLVIDGQHAAITGANVQTNQHNFIDYMQATPENNQKLAEHQHRVSMIEEEKKAIEELKNTSGIGGDQGFMNIMMSMHGEYYKALQQVRQFDQQKEAASGNTQYDFGLTLSGSAAKSLRSDFIHNWNHGQNNHAKTNPLTALPKELADPQTPSDGIEMAVLTKNPAINPLNRNLNNPQDQAILTAINHAKSSIQISTSNLNTDAVLNALLQAANRNVKVQIVTSPKMNFDRMNNLYAGDDNIKTVNRLLNASKNNPNLEVRFFLEVNDKQPTPYLNSTDKQQVTDLNPLSTHAKIMLIDHNIAITGSANLDYTSWFHAGETNLAIFHPEKTRDIHDKAFNPLWSQALPAADYLKNQQSTSHR